MLIAFEGIHKSGKSTLISALEEYLISKKKKVYVTKWNSHPIVKDVLYDMKDNNKLSDPLMFYYMQMLDFAYRYELDILPRINEGYIVLADRYIYTAKVRGKIRNIDERIVDVMCGYALKPEYCFLLDVKPETSMRRGRPLTNSVWQDGFGEKTFRQKFDCEGYKHFLSKQRELYIDLVNDEGGIIFQEELDIEEKLKMITEIIKL